MYQFIQNFLNSCLSYWEYLIYTITHPFSKDNYFYLLIVISLFVWFIEILKPWRKNQNIFRKSFWQDAFFMFFNFFLFNLFFFIAFSEITENNFIKLTSYFGLSPNGIVSLSHMPLILQFIVYFVVSDLLQWCIHRFLLHNIPFLWKFHKVHHSATEMGFATHFRYHWMETMIYKSTLYIFLAWIFHFELKYVFFLHGFNILVGHLNHSNIKLDYGILKFIFNNPKMHIWHHAKEYPISHPNGVNFGITLSLWDYLFNTIYIPYEGTNVKLGFQGIESYPKSFYGLMFEPFKRKKKK